MSLSRADLVRSLKRLAGRVECAQVRLLGWSATSLLFRQPVLVVETTGQRTGRRRRTVVAYQELDGVLMVVGGAGRQTRRPDWVANLRADPGVVVTRRRRSSDMTARFVEGPEREEMWRRLLARWPVLSKYEARAGHPIPIIRLEC